MGRIIYLVLGAAAPRGGHKVAFRHVEALCRLGYSARIRLPNGSPSPSWFEHDAPVESGGEFSDDDILVIPEDAVFWLRQFARSAHRKVVFCQNHFYAASLAGQLSRPERAAYADYMACSQTVGQWVQRYAPHARVSVVPAFADERLFAPVRKAPIIAVAPSKRKIEYKAIRYMLTHLAPERNQWRWAEIEGKSESEVAALLNKAAIYLSLSRIEGLGMITLEAMAAGCLTVGFTGIGGREYASPTNGLWVDEDDIEACAEALARAIKVASERPALALDMVAEARKTAERYSYARFVTALDSFWSERATKAA